MEDLARPHEEHQALLVEILPTSWFVSHRHVKFLSGRKFSFPGSVRLGVSFLRDALVAIRVEMRGRLQRRLPDRLQTVLTYRARRIFRLFQVDLEIVAHVIR